MLKNPKHVFILLILLAAVTFVMDLPDRYHLKFQLGPLKVNRVISPPVINFNFFGYRFYKTFTTHLGLDLSGGTHVALEADMKDIKPEDRSSALESARQVIERRVNFFGLSEPIVQTAKSATSYRIIVELPGVTNVDAAVQTIGTTAKLEFREFTDISIATSASTAAQLFAATKPADITGKDLKKAQLTFSRDTGEPEVAIEFTPEGAKKFEDVTKRLVGKPLPIFLDQMVVSVPMVKQEISGGSGVISGSFTKEGAQNLALQLNAGALPVPVSIIEKRVIGATLGQESVIKSVRAGFVGLLIVAAFMIAKYGYLGALADVALILYSLISFAIFRWFDITLTLPGIAGFILSIGMAVDSNILIFERYQEELRRGKPWRIAMEQGFGKAWDSIRDANLTTIITSLILFNPGNWQFLPSSGMVRGFAITLFIGVVISLFTGIVVTRTFIRVLYRPRLSKELA